MLRLWYAQVHKMTKPTARPMALTGRISGYGGGSFSCCLGASDPMKSRYSLCVKADGLHSTAYLRLFDRDVGACLHQSCTVLCLGHCHAGARVSCFTGEDIGGWGVGGSYARHARGKPVQRHSRPHLVARVMETDEVSGSRGVGGASIATKGKAGALQSCKKSYNTKGAQFAQVVRGKQGALDLFFAFILPLFLLLLVVVVLYFSFLKCCLSLSPIFSFAARDFSPSITAWSA